MSANLKNLEAERLLDELSAATGEAPPEAATLAFRERLERLNESKARASKRSLSALARKLADAGPSC